jgi:aldehyde:ferredoxin oxidoreductase
MATNPGYAGNILRIDLSTGRCSNMPTEIYADRFVGGRGIALKIHWDEVRPETDPFDPENRFVIMTGPICGAPGFGGSRWQVSGKSPINGGFCYGNLGGAFGVQLKLAGYDGLIIHGSADRLLYILIQGNTVEFKDASHLRGIGAIRTREIIKADHGKESKVMAIGIAGENKISFATILADSDSSCAAGLGAVMGSKNLKAVVVRSEGMINVANSNKVQELRRKVLEIKPDLIMPSMLPQDRIKKDICVGCVGCQRVNYKATTGQSGKFTCQGVFFYRQPALNYYKAETEVPFQATKLCDEVGLDTRVMRGMITWLSKCFEANLITENETGLSLSKIGSFDFLEELLNLISNKKGFGATLSDGPLKAAAKIGKDTDKLITEYMTKYGDEYVYSPRLFITSALFNALEPRLCLPQLHEIGVISLLWYFREKGWIQNYITTDVMRRIASKFWGGELAVDFSTYSGKAEAAVEIQDREYAKEALILCDSLWPITHSGATPDHVGDPSLESKIYSAITGKDIDEHGLYAIGERLFNLQRAVLASEGHRGRNDDNIEDFEFKKGLKGDLGNADCIMPGKDGETISRKGMALKRDEFEKMKDEFYKIRGWDVDTGLQKKSKMLELGLQDIAEKLELSELLA